MADLESQDTLSEITFGITGIVFLLLWLIFNFYTAIITVIVVFGLGLGLSSSSGVGVFYSFLGIGLLALFFLFVR